MQYDVVGICKAYTDEWVRVSDADLSRLGLTKCGSRPANIDEIERILASLPPGRKIAGGPVANTIAGIANLGGWGAFIGKYGDDARGRIFQDDYRQRNVFMDKNKTVIKGGDTACCLVLVTPDGERSFITNQGVSMDLGVNDMPAGLLSSGQFVFFGLPFWHESHLPVLRHAARLARQARKVINLQSYDPSIRSADFTRALLAEVDIVIGNRTEFQALSNNLGFADSAELHAKWPHTITWCETSGGDGVHIRGVEVHFIPTTPVATVTDTTGAGDAFAAGLLYGMARNWGWKKSALLGHRCATDIIVTEGARPIRPWKNFVAVENDGGGGGVPRELLRKDEGR